MPNGDATAGLAGLREWSEPIIFDLLLEAYRQRLGVGASAWTLARLHSRVWKAAIHGDAQRLETARFDLARALGEQYLGEEMAGADSQIIAELLDIVMARFQRSASVARSYHLALIALAGRLTPPPRKAAPPLSDPSSDSIQSPALEPLAPRSEMTRSKQVA
jgi:hypothetical protein